MFLSDPALGLVVIGVAFVLFVGSLVLLALGLGMFDPQIEETRRVGPPPVPPGPLVHVRRVTRPYDWEQDG